MKKNKTYIITALATAMLFTACTKEMTIGITEINEEINFSIGFANDITVISKAPDVSFKTTFEKGDAIGMFAYKRNRGEENSINKNEIYANNIKMIYDGGSWISESPIYYTNDGTLLDIYVYYPYRAGANAEALGYNVSADMPNLIAVSVIGIEKINTSWAIPILFNQVFSMVHLSIDKAGVPNLDDSSNVYFNGIIGGTYNLQTNEISNPVKGIAKMTPTGTLGRQENTYTILVPPQNIASRETIFSISQTDFGKWAWDTPELVTLVQEDILKFQITAESKLVEAYKYNEYDRYPKYGTPIGMVIEVYNDGRNGKVISLKDAGIAQWATGNAANLFVNSNNINDGLSNTKKIHDLENWRTNYPAFGLLEDGWYIPSIEEANPYFNKRLTQLNNGLLKIQGGEQLDTKLAYWTSTETSSSAVRQISVPSNSTAPASKNNYYNVRAFYRF